MSTAAFRRIGRRRDVILLHVEALVEASDRGELDASAWAQWAMILDEMEHLRDLMQVMLLEQIYERLQSDLAVR